MSRGAEHDGRASIPAPSRYQRNPTVIRVVLETGNNPEATSIPQSGDLPPVASGAGLRDAARPNPLPCGASTTAPGQSSGRGVLSRVWQGVQWRNCLTAREYLAAGLSLRDVATILSTTPAELDLALWNNLGRQYAAS